MNRIASLCLSIALCLTPAIAQQSTNSPSRPDGVESPATITAVRTTGGTVDYLPVWTTAPNILGNSNVYANPATGLVGIGTNSPLTTLQLSVSNPNELGPTLTLMNPAGGVGAGASVDFDGYNPGVGMAPAARIQSLDDGDFSAHLVFETKAPGIDTSSLREAMRISDTGLVGINKPTPTQQLDVMGEALVEGVYGFTTAGQEASVFVGDTNHRVEAINGKGIYLTAFNANGLEVQDNTGFAYANAFIPFSSRRWKTNIKPLHSALDKVEHLQGVSYDLKDNGMHQIGLIAEDVGKVVPEVVVYEQNGVDAKGVDYAKLTALLIEATKEQQQLIQKQQAQLKAQDVAAKIQQAQLNNLTAQMKVVQTALKTNGPINSSQLASNTEPAK